jgi:hypothetical protein
LIGVRACTFCKEIENHINAASVQKHLNIDRWCTCFFPIKLVKLEFSLPEETFVEQCNGAEKNLQQEQRQLQKNENVKETLQKHRVS